MTRTKKNRYPGGRKNPPRNRPIYAIISATDATKKKVQIGLVQHTGRLLRATPNPRQKLWDSGENYILPGRKPTFHRKRPLGLDDLKFIFEQSRFDHPGRKTGASLC